MNARVTRPYVFSGKKIEMEQKESCPNIMLSDRDKSSLLIGGVISKWDCHDTRRLARA